MDRISRPFGDIVLPMKNPLATLSRRAVLKALAAAPFAFTGQFPAWAQKAAGKAGLVSPNVCMVMPESTEGPFYIDPKLIREDITEGRDGAPVHLTLQVVDTDCTPVEKARVDIWHCDARGNYSGFGGPDGSTKGETFLRGTRFTNADGLATFRTIYPGWYPGRTPHIHYKVFLDDKTVLTSQLFFPDDVSDAVYANTEPYTTREASRGTSNDNDWIARRTGKAAIVSIRENAGKYVAALVIGIAQG